MDLTQFTLKIQEIGKINNVEDQFVYLGRKAERYYGSNPEKFEKVYTPIDKWDLFKYSPKTKQYDDGPNLNIQGWADIKLFLYVSWEIGGMSGGSCWDDSDPQPFHTGVEALELTIFDKILEQFYPDIKYLEYKQMVKAIGHGGEWTQFEYYGNNIVYGYNSICIEELYNYMKEKSWLK